MLYLSRAAVALATTTLAVILTACSGVQIDTVPIDRFAEGNYRSYSWWGAGVDNSAGSHDPLYVIDPSLRAAVDKALAEKGYRRVDQGGDFIIDYQFRATLSEGAVNSTALMADNRYPVPSNPATSINRAPDRALVDNAYALGGPREMNSVLLRFSDRESQGMVWAVAMSKIVEDVNHEDSDKLVKSINSAINRALRRVPRAN